MSETPFWIVLASTLADIGFSLTVGVVTVLAYRQAHRTILQPIRTEVFKRQLDELADLLSLFVGRGEIDLRRDFALHEIFELNALAMYDDYATTVLGAKIDRTKRPYNPDSCPTSRFSGAIDKYLQVADEYIDTPSDDPTPALGSAPVEAAWSDYEYVHIRLPLSYDAARRKLMRFLENPIIPSQCAKMIEEYLDTVDYNVEKIREALSEASEEMPQKYPTLEQLKRSRTHWIWASVNPQLRALKPRADAITSFVRQYCRSDLLID